MIERNPFLALALTTLVGIGIIIALYISLNDPGPPPETERERFDRVHTVFVEALAGGAAWSGRVEILGLQTNRTAAHTPGWQITGTGGACDASGSYTIRDRPANPLAIMAPHSQSDVNTGELAQLLFEQANARAVAFNTAPRRATDECESGLDLTTDRWNPFSAFALAFADSNRDGLVVQLHGHEESGSNAGQGVEVLIGAGLGASQPVNASLYSCFSEALGGGDIRVLASDAAANNAQGRVLQVQGHRNFIYIELSEELRQAMLSDVTLRGGFANCLVAATEA